jgi:hypothetical protein
VPCYDLRVVASASEQVLIELPTVVPELTHLRGTTMVASLQVLDELGLSVSLWRALPQEHHAALREVVASSWVDVQLGLAYYKALDTLGLSAEHILSIGRGAALRLQSNFVHTLVRGMQGAVTPCTVLGRMDKLWARSFRGGAVRVLQVAPKDLRLEVHGAAFLDVPYTRIALMGYFEQTLVATARRVFVKELNQPAPAAAAWRLSWV